MLSPSVKGSRRRRELNGIAIFGTTTVAMEFARIRRQELKPWLYTGPVLAELRQLPTAHVMGVSVKAESENISAYMT